MENAPKTSNRFEQFRSFTRYYLKFAGCRFYTLQALELIKLFTKNLSLVSILPLLAVAGFLEWTPPSGILSHISDAIKSLGLASSLNTVILVYVSLMTLNHLISYWQTQISVTLSQKFHVHLRNELLHKMLHAEWAYLLTQHNAHLTHTYMTDLGRVQNSGRLVIDLLKASISAIIVTALAALISWQLTLVGVLAASIGIFLQILFTKQMHQSAIENRKNARQLFSHMIESLAGLKLVKAFAHEDLNLKKFRKQSEESSRITITQSRQNALQSLIKGLLLSIFIAIFVAIALPLLENDGLLIGLFFVILNKVNGSVQSIVGTSRQIITHIPSFDAYQSFLNELEANSESLIKTKHPKLSFESGITLDKLTFAYAEPSRQPAIREISLDIPARKTTAIFGPSGAGKTTLMDLLLGLLKPSSGSILIDKQPLEGALRNLWRQSIAYIPQEPFLFNDSIRANMTYFTPDAQDAAIWECLETANALEFVQKLENGLDTVVGDRGHRMSGGERQRLTLARALMRKPKVLFLDEATSNLDYITESKIQTAIERLHGSITIIIISHRKESLRFADRIVELADGALVKVSDKNP